MSALCGGTQALLESDGAMTVGCSTPAGLSRAVQQCQRGLAAPGLPPPRSPCPRSRGGGSTYGGACAPQATQHGPITHCRPWLCSKEGFTPFSSLFPSSSGSSNGCRRASPLLSVLQGCCLLPLAAGRAGAQHGGYILHLSRSELGEPRGCRAQGQACPSSWRVLLLFLAR